MTQRQFLLGIFCLIAFFSIVSVIGYFHIEERKAENEKERIIQQEATTRTKERWRFLNQFTE